MTDRDIPICIGSAPFEFLRTGGELGAQLVGVFVDGFVFVSLLADRIGGVQIDVIQFR